MLETIQKLAAFSDGARGNPAGVWIGPLLPSTGEMQRIAAEVGYSETAFASPIEQVGGCAISRPRWRCHFWSCDHCPWSRTGPVRGANQVFPAIKRRSN